ncbi:MAG: ATP-binding protein [Candidatus Cryosericum sp.]
MAELKRDFGVLYGQKTTEDALLIYSSYEDSKDSPQTGDFIVLAPSSESGTKYLARVEAEIYDEDPIFRSQDKTLIAVHYARVAERPLSERDKQKMFSYTYKVRILGTFTDGASSTFTTAVRKLPTVSYIARHLKQVEVDRLINQANENGVSLGYLCVGDTPSPELGPVLFRIDKLRRSRTMVFAQSGYGKTNLMKVLILNMVKDKSYGKLIFDLNGEYFAASGTTKGLWNVLNREELKNLIVYSDRHVKLPPGMPEGSFHPSTKLNTVKHLTVGDILQFSTGFTDVMKSFLAYLEDNGVEDFILNIDGYVNDPAKLHKDYPDFFKSAAVGASVTIAGIRKRIAYLIDSKKGLHDPQSSLVEDVMSSLSDGKTVIIDLSLRGGSEASVVATILVRELFERNKELYIKAEEGSEDGLDGNGKKVGPIETVVFVEEAQNVLSEDQVRSSSNPFVRVAKEGRKFGLGLVAITQRPSAISDEIRSQADNFFALHMGNMDDVKALVKSNSCFDGVVERFIQSEPIVGNLYMVSQGQSFAVPIRVHEFEKMPEEEVNKTEIPASVVPLAEVKVETPEPTLSGK